MAWTDKEVSLLEGQRLYLWCGRRLYEARRSLGGRLIVKATKVEDVSRASDGYVVCLRSDESTKPERGTV